MNICNYRNLRQRKLEIVSCPSCGRAQVDVYTLAEKVQAGLQGMTVPLRVAVMGCVVNGGADSETRIVSPIPSANKIPNAVADLIVPWNRGPASVTPKCNG